MGSLTRSARITIAVVHLVAFSSLQAAAQTGDFAAIRTVEVRPGVYMLQGAGGNVGAVVTEDGLLLVDDDAEEVTHSLLRELARLSHRPILFVVNTHWHHDHTAGNANLSHAGALVTAHENARRRMIVEQVIVPPMTGGRAPALSEDGWPVISFTGEMTFHISGKEVRVIHVPQAHTDGDAIIHFVDDDVIHMGDVYFSRQYPNIDVGSGGTIDGMIAAQEFALSLASEGTRFIPGHGDLASREDVEATVKMLREVRSRVAMLIEENLTQDEAVACQPLTDLEAKWGHGYIKADRMVIQAFMSIEARTD